MKRKTLVVVLFAIPLYVLDALLFVNGKIPLQAALITLLTFAVILVILLRIRRGKNETIQADERTMRISSRATTYSWWITLYAILMLMGLNTLEVLHVSVVQCLLLILYVMLLSQLVLNIVMNRRGDVE